MPYTSNIMRQREIHRRLEDIFDADGVINMTYLQVCRPALFLSLASGGGERPCPQADVVAQLAAPLYTPPCHCFCLASKILWEVFRRYDDDMDSFLSTDELLKVLETGFGKEAATENTARDYIGRYDSRGSKMSRDGFVQLVADLSEDKIRELISYGQSGAGAWGWNGIVGGSRPRAPPFCFAGTGAMMTSCAWQRSVDLLFRFTAKAPYRSQKYARMGWEGRGEGGDKPRVGVGLSTKRSNVLTRIAAHLPQLPAASQRRALPPQHEGDDGRDASSGAESLIFWPKHHAFRLFEVIYFSSRTAKARGLFFFFFRRIPLLPFNSLPICPRLQ